MLYEDREARTFRALDALHIEYTLLHHAAAYTMDDCRAIARESGVAYCKNLFLSNRQHTRLYLLCLRENETLRTSDVSHQLGVSRLSFAPDALLPDCLGLLPGSVSPLGLLFDTQGRVTLLLDRALRGFERVAFHPCVNTATVILRTQDWINTFLPSIAHTPTWVRIGEEEECVLCSNASCPTLG